MRYNRDLISNAIRRINIFKQICRVPREMGRCRKGYLRNWNIWLNIWGIGVWRTTCMEKWATLYCQDSMGKLSKYILTLYTPSCINMPEGENKNGFCFSICLIDEIHKTQMECSMRSVNISNTHIMKERFDQPLQSFVNGSKVCMTWGYGINLW